MKPGDRQALVDLLARWERGEISAWQMVEEAEAAEEQLHGDLEAVPEIPKSDPSSIPIAVLELLAMAHHERLLPTDIPAILRFLGTVPGDELSAWQEFDRYWDSIDLTAREPVATELYFGSRGAKDEFAG